CRSCVSQTVSPIVPGMTTCDTHLPLLLWLFTAAFAARVAAQLVQRVAARSWLPDFAAFQGGAWSYPALLTTQAAILVLMSAIAVHAHACVISASPRLASVLTVAGSIYFATMALRLAIGIAFARAPRWFKSWIPASFHLVLAAFVIAWGAILR